MKICTIILLRHLSTVLKNYQEQHKGRYRSNQVKIHVHVQPIKKKTHQCMMSRLDIRSQAKFL